MILIATILLIAQCGAANLDFLKILLSGNLEEVHVVISYSKTNVLILIAPQTE